jgi:hypothetical protein
LIVCPRFVRGILPLSWHVPCGTGRHRHWCRDPAVTHASAIMRVLMDGLISIVAGCLSPAAGRGHTGLWALPLTGRAAVVRKGRWDP